MSAKDKISKAKYKLILNNPFFATLLFGLDIVDGTEWIDASGGAKTMATDGRRIFYHKEFVEQHSMPELIGALAHEVMHCAMLHMYRLRGRDLKLWNIATDIAINQVLTKPPFTPDGSTPEGFGFTLPPNWLMVYQGSRHPDGLSTWIPEYENQTAEWIYDDLKSKALDQERSSLLERQALDTLIDPLKSPGSSEEGDDGQAPLEDLEALWREKLQRAKLVAEQAGKMPSSLLRQVGELLRPKVNWRSLLHQFVDQMAANREDYWWRLPNKRYIAHGFYMPGLYSEVLPPLVVAIDTSGSIDDEMLREAISELNWLRQTYKIETTYLVYCDCRVAGVEIYGMEDDISVTQPKGGGGTSFVPPFEWVERQGINPAALIYFTDGYGDAPRHPPEYPVLWMLFKHGADDFCNWGQKVRIENA